MRLLICLLLLISSMSTHAVKYVYRMDYRPPEYIFEHGFEILGGNTDLYLHVEGESCYSGSRDSSFISTSASSQFPVDWGAASQAGTDFYVYRIRADQTFYNTHDSLMAAYNRTAYNPFYSLADNMAYQEEFASLGSILPRQIERVTMYTSNGRDVAPTLRLELYNNGYVDGNTETNAHPYFIPARNDSDTESSCSACMSHESSDKKRDISSGIETTLQCRSKFVNSVVFF